MPAARDPPDSPRRTGARSADRGAAERERLLQMKLEEERERRMQAVTSGELALIALCREEVCARARGAALTRRRAA